MPLQCHTPVPTASIAYILSQGVFGLFAVSMTVQGNTQRQRPTVPKGKIHKGGSKCTPLVPCPLQMSAAELAEAIRLTPISLRQVPEAPVLHVCLLQAPRL